MKKILAKQPDAKLIAQAVKFIKAGELVVFPTETVYGLGASAFNASAVRKIFKVKGRPEKKPLIVHVAKKSTIDELAYSIPKAARKLVKQFWPGPLTLVLKRKKNVLDEVTGGGETVAIRMPDHLTALSLIRAVGPIAAPSANLHNNPPPKSVTEIDPRIKKGAKMVLDGGKCVIGKPSTIVTFLKGAPIILRQGSISRAQILRVLQNQ